MRDRHIHNKIEGKTEIRDLFLFNVYSKLVCNDFQVSKDCGSVFVDGNETRGSENVTVVVRVGGHATRRPLAVWVPEPRLDVALSDNKLSWIRYWSVPRHTQRR